MAFELTEFLNDLYTSTWQNMKDTVADQVFDATPFYFWLKDKGRMETVAGGRFLTEPLQYDKNDNISWVGKGGTVSLNDFEHLTIAKYDWRYLVGSIVRFGVDDQQNRGKNQIINLMNSKMENTRNALISQLETRLAAASGSADNAIDGLQLLVADDPTASAEIGGINQSTNAWWRNQAENMTGLSFATYGEAKMRTMLNNTSNNLRMDTPDIIVSGQVPYEYFEDTQMGYVQIVNKKLGDAGFSHVQFKGLPMIWSPSIADTRMYFLNTNFIKFAYDPMVFFDMTDWKPIPDQVNDVAAQIVTACAFKVSRRRCQGVLFNIDTP